MSKKRIVIICLIGIILALGIILLSFYIKGNRIIKEVEEKVNSNEIQVVLIGKDSCIHCQRLKPKLDDFASYYEFNYYYVNLNDFVYSKQKEALFNLIELTYDDFPGTPYLVVTQKGKVLKALIGNTSEENLYNFLNDNELINSSVEPINYLNINEYLNIIAKKENSLLYIGQENCDDCVSARSNLYSLAKEYNLVINYLNLSTLSNNKVDNISDVDRFEQSMELFSEDIQTPLLLIINDKEVIDKTYLFNKNNYIDFLTKNEYISGS